MAIPKTEKELREQGYRFHKQGKCNGPNCRADIEWWDTPANKQIPLDPGTMLPHWSTCPDADRFRRAK
jgi:hypothetical protein